MMSVSKALDIGRQHVVRGIASALAQLHRDGYSHGDMYAHNIMINNADGEPRLGDFGAAFCYKSTSIALEPFEQIEVRAFGCLVEELAAHLDYGAGSTEVATVAGTASNLKATLEQLSRSCMGPIDDRPSFEHIYSDLQDAKL
eukprot:scaffold299782_cov33-Tisochrysis_lutea.AAC.2